MHKIRLDFTLLIFSLCLSAFSLAVIWSANSSYLLVQLIFFILGFILFFTFNQFDAETLKNISFPVYIISLLMLILTLFSPNIRGASRWIEIFGVQLQPSEIFKPFLTVSFAYFLSKSKQNDLLDIFKIILILIIPIVIIFLQPDLGNVIIYVIFTGLMLIANNLSKKTVLIFIVLSLLISPFAWQNLRGYQRSRIVNFLNPHIDPQGAGYNAIQSTIAVGSGGLWGMGLGRGTQSHLRFLPENHTDFIFASLIEEFGLVGGLLLLSFYLIIFIRILNIAKHATNRFSYLVTIGIFAQILSQAFINISMNTGLIPVTGVTLPLVSSGGSSIIAVMSALGIVASFNRQDKPKILVIK